MQITLYDRFQKRNNSTKLPSGTTSVTLTGTLKDPCTVENPVIQFQPLSGGSTHIGKNYAYIPEFERYYFITDWKWNTGLWECYMEEDVLASWKTSIGNTSAYIERSASTFNGAIRDKLYPVTTNFVTTSVSLTTGYYGTAPSGGIFVLGIINNANFSTSQPGGAVTYYAMTPDQMRSLMHYLLSTGFLNDAGFPAQAAVGQQLLQETAKAFINPVQYIASCLWFPLNISDIAESGTSNIVLGYWDLDSNVARGHKVNMFTYTDSVQGTIPIHPQSATRGKYLNYSPYTRLSIHVPPFGTIPLDTSYCELGSYLWGKIYVDIITGKAQLRIKIQPDNTQEVSNVIVGEAVSMMGIPIQIAQITPNYLDAMSSVVQFASGIASGIASGVAGQADLNALMSLNSVGNALDSLMPQIRTEGISGSFIQNVMPPSLTAQHFIITNEDNTEMGKPLCEVQTINNLSGFIKCGEATVDFGCYNSERDKIHSFMINGFFWE